MLRRSSFVWLVVAAAFWTGCAFGPLGSRRAVSPVEAPVDYDALVHLSPRGAEKTVPQALTAGEVETLWGKLAAQTPGLADQAAGEEIVIRHVYGEEPVVPFSEMTDAGKMMALVCLAIGVGVCVWAMSGMTTY